MAEAVRPGALLAELRELVSAGAEQHTVPGAAVGILLGDDQYFACHGVTSLSNPLPVNEDTYFQLGSTGKTYTGTAVMVLAERGLIDLEAPVRRYLPELRLADPTAADQVTVLGLLNHTAGWAGDFFRDTGFGDDALARFIDALEAAEQESPPGQTVSYNNTSLSVAGRIIEKIHGKPFDVAIKELVFEPVGLASHSYLPWQVMIHRFAVGHLIRQDDTAEVAGWYEPRYGFPAGGGLAAPVRDQLAWARFHLGDGRGADGRQVLSPESLRRMQEPTVAVPHGDPGDAWGITWALRQIDGVRIVEHGGSSVGQMSAFLMVPERRFAIAACANSSHGKALNDEIVEWALAAYLGLTKPEELPLELSPDQLAEFAGTYEAELGTTEVTVAGSRLRAVITLDEEAIRQIVGPDGKLPDPPDPMELAVLDGDRYVVTAGSGKGETGALIRDDVGRVTGIELGGRVMKRQG